MVFWPDASTYNNPDIPRGAGKRELYVAGAFDRAGNVAASGIARWDGVRWASVGGGIRGTVYAMAIFRGELYVAGYFDRAGTVPVHNIAKWNGRFWQPVGTGLASPTWGTPAGYALQVWNNSLYVGGSFRFAGGVHANNIARWDGHSWSPVGEGFPEGMVNAIEPFQNELYVGGIFKHRDLAGIARWNGISWSSIGEISGGGTAIIVDGYPVYGQVTTLCNENGRLWVGGIFTNAGHLACTNLAIWTGQHWTTSVGSADQIVGKIFKGSDGVYVGGGFEHIGGISAHAARWDARGWHPLDVHGAILAFTESDAIYAGGTFVQAGDSNAAFVARWNHRAWSALGKTQTNNVPDGYLESLASDGQNVYVSGDFDSVGTLNDINLAKWDDYSWTPFNYGSGLGYRLMAAASNHLYQAEGDGTIESWDGQQWIPIGVTATTNLYGSVFQMSACGNKLYVYGNFYSISGISAIGFAMWDGASWSAIPQLSSPDVYSPIWIQKMTADESNLYVVGVLYSSTGGPEIDYLFRWNGVSWLPVGNNITGAVDGVHFSIIALQETNIYVAGYFTNVAGVAATNIACWNGQRWSSLGNTDSSLYVSDMVASGTSFYVGGFFNQIAGVDAKNIAKWDGLQWSPLGSGLNNGVTHLTKAGLKIYAAGYFTTAGGKPSFNFAAWDEAGPK